MQSGFTIDEKNRLVFLRTSDDKNQVVEEASERTIRDHRIAYEEFVERTARGGAPADRLPESVRKDVVAMRSGGLMKKEAARHAAEQKRLGEVARAPKRAKAAKPAKAKKKARRAK